MKENIGHIYLIQTRESIRCDDNIYKIGRTTQDNFKRICSYPNGSQMIYHIVTSDVKEVEKKILELFKNKYRKSSDFGREYFEGSYQDMIDDIRKIVKLPKKFKYKRNNEYSLEKSKKKFNKVLKEFELKKNKKNKIKLICKFCDKKFKGKKSYNNHTEVCLYQTLSKIFIKLNLFSNKMLNYFPNHMQKKIISNKKREAFNIFKQIQITIFHKKIIVLFEFTNDKNNFLYFKDITKIIEEQKFKSIIKHDTLQKILQENGAIFKRKSDGRGYSCIKIKKI